MSVAAGRPAVPPAGAAVARRGGWLAAALAGLGVMMMVGLALVWWWGRRPGPPLAVLGQVPAFRLTERSGRVVGAAELAGRPWVVDLIFTRCQISCPALTERLVALGPRLPPAVRRVSVSVDPAHDTPPVLDAYVRVHHAESPDWWFLTGDPAQLHRLAYDGLKLGVSAASPDDPRASREPITHSTKLVLIDGQGRVRGYYDAFDEGSVGQLVRDAGRLAAGTAGEPEP